MKKYITEFIGTFFLVITIVLTVNGSAGAMAPLAIGAVLMVMVFAGGHISGAHYNPAVTLGVWFRGKCPTSDVPGYIVAQLSGGIVASYIGSYLIHHIPGIAGVSPGYDIQFLPAILAEFIGTFALVWVVLNVATSKDTEGNSFYGLAIGFTIMACAYGLGSVTGGAFNPAVALAMGLTGMTTWSNFLVFILGQALAGWAAAAAFRYASGE